MEENNNVLPTQASVKKAKNSKEITIYILIILFFIYYSYNVFQFGMLFQSAESDKKIIALQDQLRQQKTMIDQRNATQKIQPTIPIQETTIVVADTDNNGTIRAVRGERIKVELHSTYWTFTTQSDILQQVSEPTYAPQLVGHIPGLGAGTVTVFYTVIKTGNADILASRTSCGEAIRCVGDQGNFIVHVIAAE